MLIPEEFALHSGRIGGGSGRSERCRHLPKNHETGKTRRGVSRAPRAERGKKLLEAARHHTAPSQSRPLIGDNELTQLRCCCCYCTAVPNHTTSDLPRSRGVSPKCKPFTTAIQVVSPQNGSAVLSEKHSEYAELRDLSEANRYWRQPCTTRPHRRITLPTRVSGKTISLSSFAAMLLLLLYVGGRNSGFVQSTYLAIIPSDLFTKRKCGPKGVKGRKKSTI